MHDRPQYVQKIYGSEMFGIPNSTHGVPQETIQWGVYLNDLPGPRSMLLRILER